MFVVFVAVRSESVLLRGAVVAGEAVFVLVVGRDLRKLGRREVLFAVHPRGIYFGSNDVRDDVAWSRIRAVELFVERVPSGRSQRVHRCIAVRSAGTQPVAREGNAPGAGRIPRISVRYFEDAGRLDLLPGADGTIRWACRRMNGWRIDRRRLEESVRRHGPGVPVVDGPDWPPVLSVGEALAAGRVRRARRR